MILKSKTGLAKLDDMGLLMPRTPKFRRRLIRWISWSCYSPVSYLPHQSNMQLRVIRCLTSMEIHPIIQSLCANRRRRRLEPCYLTRKNKQNFHQKGNITMETVMNTLPDQDLMCAQMAVSFTLSMPPADEVIMTLRNQTKPTFRFSLASFR